MELTIGGESAAALATQMAKDLGAEIDREAAALLADILNGEPARIRIELEKLATYAHRTRTGSPRPTWKLSWWPRARIPSGSLRTCWQAANASAALAFLDNLLREGEQPAGIVGALAWMYRKLIEARDLPAHTNGFQAARQLGMRPDAAEAAVRQAHRIPKKELLAGLAALAEADSQLKSANPESARDDGVSDRAAHLAPGGIRFAFRLTAKTKGAPKVRSAWRKIARLR